MAEINAIRNSKQQSWKWNLETDVQPFASNLILNQIAKRKCSYMPNKGVAK